MADVGSARPTDAAGTDSAVRRQDEHDATIRLRVGHAMGGRSVLIASILVKLILMIAVMAIAFTALTMCLRYSSPIHAAAAEQESRPAGMGVKDAIQDLYAEIKASEADGLPGSTFERLDVATSAKAQYVSDSLRRMIGDSASPGARDGPAVGGRASDSTLAAKDDRTHRTGSKPRTGDSPSSPPPLSHEDVNELVQRFIDVLEHFDRSKPSSSATTVLADLQRGLRALSSTTRWRSGRGMAATTHSTTGPGLFKLAMFNRHHRVVTPTAAR